MEARPPAENRHGGAPRGERPASWDAPRLTRADQSRLANATNEIVRLSALRPPLLGDGRDHKDKTRAQQRAAGTNNTALFDIVNTATANGSFARRGFACSDLRLPIAAQPSVGDPTDRLGFSLCTRPGHETDTLFGRDHLL